MVIDNASPESYVTLAEGARLCPKRGKRHPHPQALWRWCRHGIKSRSGVFIRLECVRIGGRVYTTAAALDRFFRAVAESDAVYFDKHNATVRAAS